MTVASYRDLPLAGLAKSRLESEGIECFLLNENTVGVNWLYSTALGGVEVQVREEDAERALEILEDEGLPETSAHEEVPLEFPEETEEFPDDGPDVVCERCGSANVSPVQSARKVGAWALLLGLPLIFFRKRYKCEDCGHVMK